MAIQKAATTPHNPALLLYTKLGFIFGVKTPKPHLWSAQLGVYELVALDEGDAQLCWHNTPPSTDLHTSRRWRYEPRVLVNKGLHIQTLSGVSAKGLL